MQDFAPIEQRQARTQNTRTQRHLAAVVYYALRISIVAFVTLLLSGGAISHRSGEGMASPLTHHVRDVSIYEDSCPPEHVGPCGACPPRCEDCDWPPVCYVLVAIIIFLILLLLALLPKPVPAIMPDGRQRLIAAIRLRFATLRTDAARFGLAQSIPLMDRAELEVIAEINNLR